MFRGLILAAALVAAPGLAASQQPAQTPAKPVQSQAHDTTKAKPNRTAARRHRAKPKPAAHDSTTRHDSTPAKP